MLRQHLNNLTLACCLIGAAQVCALPEDFDQEIIIVSDKAELDRKSGTVIYQGNVELTQGTLLIKANRLTVISVDDRLEKAIADGKPAIYQQQIQANQPLTFAEANRIEYLAQKREAILMNNAKLNQDGNVLTGNLIRYDMDTEVVSAGKTQSGEPSRIRVVIQPQNKTKTEDKP